MVDGRWLTEMIMRTLCVGFILAMSMAVAAQAPAPNTAARPPTRPTGTLAQVMRGIYFPNANLIFDVQQSDPGAPKKAPAEPTGSGAKTYANAYTAWGRGENSAIALPDGVDLILPRRRLCENGKPVPVRQADFQK